jgi:hypothetical protein
MNLASTRICDICESICKLHCKHPRMGWFIYLCPKCDEEEYITYFPNKTQIIKNWSKRIIETIKDELKWIEPEYKNDVLEKLKEDINILTL